MASRYWVGGTGNWSDATNHWSDSSGGTPGAGFLPTSADDVYFDDNSAAATFTVTLNAVGNCHNIDFSGLSVRACIFTIGNQTLNIYGSVYVVNNVTGSSLSSGKFVFLSTVTEEILTPGYQKFSAGRWEFRGSGGKWTFIGDSASNYSALYHYSGEIDLNGYGVEFQTYSSQSNPVTLTLNGSTFTIMNFNIGNSASFTFNYGVGTVKIRASNATISATGSITFYNLIIESNNQPGHNGISLSTDITVTNLLIINGSNNRYRIFVCSNRGDTQRTITSAANNFQYVDFQDIVGAGSASWDFTSILSGIGDGGNNSNMTFLTSKTCYWYGGSGNWIDDTKWFSGSGGTGTPNYYPLIQDTVIFDDNSLTSATVIIIETKLVCKDLYINTIIYELTVNGGYAGQPFRVFGSIYLCNLVAFGSMAYIYVMGRGEIYLDANGASIDIINMSNSNGMMYLLSDLVVNIGFNTGANSLSGLDFNDYNITTPIFQSYGKTIYFRSGILTVTGSGIILIGDIYAETGKILIAPTTTVSTVNFTFYNQQLINIIEYSGGTGKTLNINTPSNFYYIIVNELIISAGSTFKVSSTGSIRIYSITANGTEAEPIIITSTSTIQHTLYNLSYNDFIVTNCNISYSNVIGVTKIKKVNSATWSGIKNVMLVLKAEIKRVYGVFVNSSWIARNSTDSGNNSGWNFE